VLALFLALNIFLRELPDFGLDLVHGLDALGAKVLTCCNVPCCHAHTLNVRVEATLGATLRVTDVIASLSDLPAIITLCHC
jgi:hypothetical protein